MYYELATMTLPFGTAGAAATQVQAFCTAPEARGELLACWFTDIGQLNQMIVLRGFADLASLEAERARTQQSASPFGCGEIFQTLEQHSYKGFGWMKPVRPSAESGITGPVYEIRTYGIKTGGVQATTVLLAMAWLKNRTPAQRWGNVKELEGAVVFLASTASDFVNGHVLYVDGGMLAAGLGEGGLIAMMALASQAVKHRPVLRSRLLVLGIFGTAIFYGDGVITPAISVLSAVEGLEVAAPALLTLSASPLHDPLVADDPWAEHYWLGLGGYLTPSALQLGRTGQDAAEPVKALPAFFDTDGLRVEQRFATSKDGTQVGDCVGVV